MNGALIVAIIACAISGISLVYTMSKDNSKKNSIDSAQFAEIKAALSNRADNAEFMRMSAKIDYMCQNIADMKMQFEKLQDDSISERREFDKRLTVIERWKDEADL